MKKKKQNKGSLHTIKNVKNQNQKKELDCKKEQQQQQQQ